MYKEAREQGYKEAEERAKGWLEENADKYCSMISGELYFEEDELISNFEAYMNILWEGEK